MVNAVVAFGVSLLLALGALALQPGAASPADEPCEVFHMDGVGLVCERGPGHYEHFSTSGRSLGFSHGPDYAPRDGGDVFGASFNHDVPCPGGQPYSYSIGSNSYVCVTPPVNPPPPPPPPTVESTGMLSRAVHCVDHDAPDTVYRTRVIYARSFDDDPWQLEDNDIRAMAVQANSRVDTDGMRNSIHTDFRTDCRNGTIEVYREILWSPLAISDFNSITQDLRTRPGFDNPRMKYWVYFDNEHPTSPGIAGQGSRMQDDSAAAGNLNNGLVVQYAVTYESGWFTWLHEAGHTLGAVQATAPHANDPPPLGNGGHCYERLDIMCYDDDQLGYLYWVQPFNCTVSEFDCREDDYFSTAPAPGTYLTNNWNIGADYVRFTALDASTVNLPIDCSTHAWYTGHPLACAFVGGSTDASQVTYTVDWGDGTTSTAGPFPSGTPASLEHAYTQAGSYRIHIYADDIGGSADFQSGGVPWDVKIDDPPTVPCAPGGDCPITVGRP